MYIRPWRWQCSSTRFMLGRNVRFFSSSATVEWMLLILLAAARADRRRLIHQTFPNPAPVLWRLLLNFPAFPGIPDVLQLQRLERAEADSVFLFNRRRRLDVAQRAIRRPETPGCRRGTRRGEEDMVSALSSPLSRVSARARCRFACRLVRRSSLSTSAARPDDSAPEIGQSRPKSASQLPESRGASARLRTSS